MPTNQGKEAQTPMLLRDDARRQVLSQHLHALDGCLGDLYDRAVAELSSEEFSEAHLLLAAHCVRELVNRLPDRLEDASGVPPRSGTGGLERDLLAAWRAELIPLENAGTSAVHVTISGALFAAVRAVVDAVSTGEGNASKRLAVVAIGQATDAPHGTVREFKRAVDFFTANVHLGSPHRTIPDRQDAVQALEKIESVLFARLGAFFEVADDLNLLVTDANRRGRGADTSVR